MSEPILTYYGINVISAENPVRKSASTIDIDLTVNANGEELTIPFTADANDGEAHGRALYEMANNGDFGEVLIE